MTRSRRAGLSRDEVRRQPLYARMLGLQYLAPSGFLCFVFLEGAVALGILLALAELVSWWGVLALPVTVAVMVKLNDVVAGALTRAAAAGTGRTAYGGAPGAVGDDPGSAPSERALRGARTVRLAPSVIARAARGARRDDQATYGKRSAERRPGAAAESQRGAATESQPGPATMSQPSTAAESQPGPAAESRPSAPAESRPDAAAESRFGTPAEDWSSASPDSWLGKPPPSRPGEAVEPRAARPTESWSGGVPENWSGDAPGSSRWTARAGDDHLPAFQDDPEAINAPRTTRPWAGQLDDQQQRARQSASRRYQ